MIPTSPSSSSSINNNLNPNRPQSSNNLNPNDYDPISTLEKQYNLRDYGSVSGSGSIGIHNSSRSPNINTYNNLGKRLVLILKLNNACVIPGGVDTVLKINEKNGMDGSNNINSSDYHAVLNRMESNASVTSYLSSGTAVNNNHHDVDNTNVIVKNLNEMTLQPNTKNNTTTHSSDGNPFDFLYDDNSQTSSKLPSSSQSLNHKGGGGKQFKVSSILAKAKNQFERGVTNIAVQAQKATSAYGGSKSGGDIRDIITIGAYVQDPNTGEYNICIGMTERHKLPVPPSPVVDESTGAVIANVSGGEGILFQIPILLPPHLLEVGASSLNVKFNLWIRSGAAIFAKNRALRRYYSAGNASLQIGSLVQAVKPKQFPIMMTLPIQSNIIIDGKLTMTVVPDTKFPPMCGNGWSLSDPKIDSAYKPIVGKRQLFNPPLDQNYIFPFPKKSTTTQTNNTMLIATERTTESTLILPLATAYSELVYKAAEQSKNHAVELTSKLQCVDGALSINDPMKALQLGHAQVQVEVIHFLRYSAVNGGNGDVGGGNINIMINLQRPDSIFENCIAHGTVPSLQYIQNATYPQHPSISVPFYPRIVLSSDPRLLPGEATTRKTFHLGKLRFELSENGVGGAGSDVFSPIGPTGAVGTSLRRMEAIVDIDMYVNLKHESLVQATVVDLKTGGSVGILVVKLAANTMEGMFERTTEDISTNVIGAKSAQPCVVDGGLISFVGLETLMEDDKACYPHSDLDSEAAMRVFAKVTSNASNEARMADRRKRQIATMGEFLTYVYMNNHVRGQRLTETHFLNDKFEAYKMALFTPANEGEEELTPDKRRDPRPFRPSSSRMEPILSGIGFNVHVQNFAITTVTTDESTGKCEAKASDLFSNVTCGAPADHFRGYGKKGQSEASISGGLRRLEIMRRTTAQYVRDSQDRLIEAIAKFYNDQSKCTNVHLPGRSDRHIAPSNYEISSLRTACIAATQKLHTLTWDIAVRRSNVFSQALGIAVTLYVTHISDKAKLQRAAWAESWQKHGFLIAFEGLLSAAGKELGMIEDAAVGISMLRMASVMIVTEQNKLNGGSSNSSCIPVPDSPFIKWIRINPSGKGCETTYLVEICVDGNFYAQNIPNSLKGKTSIRFYPMLYEMGVDIRQWGSNATNFTKNSGQDDLDDDEVGFQDNDVLIALNYEAFRKMNAYAHSVYRCSEDPPLTWEQADSPHQTHQQQIHPMLRNLHEYIKSSAGKMEHGILDEAAHAAAKLGGGAAIFCKSGKDRTAMQVTFKQSQFVNRWLETGGDGLADNFDLDFDKVCQDAGVMRVYGTRLPICDKNVGQSLYAFNSLQARFMPEALKPPPRALAGFLKGGRVFSKEGLIES